MLQWTQVTQPNTWRLRVKGGWIVKSIHERCATWMSGASNAIAVGMIFISDPNHEWHLEE